MSFQLLIYMSVVGKSTCSGLKAGLYMSYHGGNGVRYIKQRRYFLKDVKIVGRPDSILCIGKKLVHYGDL